MIVALWAVKNHRGELSRLALTEGQSGVFRLRELKPFDGHGEGVFEGSFKFTAEDAAAAVDVAEGKCRELDALGSDVKRIRLDVAGANVKGCVFQRLAVLEARFL